uniref:Uncharacterized protein n=1 Tax=Timema shepardi TaxID=629360 RepID=A0A7R9AM38_TIMSH|nr:unnamed protein product [Timema shepardi]
MWRKNRATPLQRNTAVELNTTSALANYATEADLVWLDTKHKTPTYLDQNGMSQCHAKLAPSLSVFHQKLQYVCEEKVNRSPRAVCTAIRPHFGSAAPTLLLKPLLNLDKSYAKKDDLAVKGWRADVMRYCRVARRCVALVAALGVLTVLLLLGAPPTAPPRRYIPPSQVCVVPLSLPFTGSDSRKPHASRSVVYNFCTRKKERGEGVINSSPSSSYSSS